MGTSGLRGVLGLGLLLAAGASAAPEVVMPSGDDPVVEVRVPEGSGAVDVRLVAIDPVTGLSARALDEVLGCSVERGEVLLVRGVGGGQQATLMLPPALAMGTYRVQSKSSDANGGWGFVGPSMTVAMQALDRVTLCPPPTTMRLDLQPLLRAALVDARGATVALRVGAKAFQGVRVNHEGWVLTSVDLAAVEGSVHGLVRWSGGSREAAVAYQVVESWGPVTLLQPVGDEGDGLMSAPHVRWMHATATGDGSASSLPFEHTGRLYAVRRGTQQLIPVSVTHPRGAPIDAAQPLEVGGDLSEADVGSPLLDHAGRVWGVLTSPTSAVWSPSVLDAFEERSNQQVGALTMNALEAP